MSILQLSITSYIRNDCLGIKHHIQYKEEENVLHMRPLQRNTPLEKNTSSLSYLFIWFHDP